jgi:hypothetical protein
MSDIRPYPWPVDRGRPHIIVVNRWRERYAEYASYIDHAHHRVSYVTTEVGLDSVPLNATQAVVVERTDDLDAVRVAVRELTARYGPPAGIVALKEDDLLIGAQLRQDWDLPGQMPRDLIVFRDKYLMSRAVQKAGLPLPAFAAAPDARAVADFARIHGWPVIIKPRVGSSSAGVAKLDSPADLVEVDFGGEPLLVQEYRPEPIYHVDGVFDGLAVRTLRASRYLNTCLGFRTGSVLGSVEVDDADVNAAIATATEAYLAALTSSPTVFHLELFVGRDDDGTPRCQFLEVGARTGGAEIPFIWREIHGYDLMEAAVRTQLCLPLPAEPPSTPLDQVGGWLLVPAPATRPCRVTLATPMVGRQPGPYAEALLQPGDVIPAADAYYEHVGGRFRFRGPSSAAVEAAVIATARDFQVAGEPLEVEPVPVATTTRRS